MATELEVTVYSEAAALKLNGLAFLVFHFATGLRIYLIAHKRTAFPLDLFCFCQIFHRKRTW